MLPLSDKSGRYVYTLSDFIFDLLLLDFVVFFLLNPFLLLSKLTLEPCGLATETNPLRPKC